jgi:hypothetical protein
LFYYLVRGGGSNLCFEICFSQVMERKRVGEDNWRRALLFTSRVLEHVSFE